MLVRLIYFLLLMFLAKFLLRALSEWMDQSSRRRVNEANDPGRPKTLHRGAMVRDRVCGLNLPADRALSEVHDGERLYFCSEKCRDEYLGAKA